jgi:hypothetical protein
MMSETAYAILDHTSYMKSDGEFCLSLKVD